MVGLAVLVGLIGLTGEPRSIAECEIVGLTLALWLTLRGYGEAAVSWGRRARFLGAIVLAGAWGVAIGAAQLLPGYDFITLSQRANEPYSFFASGSLPTQWTVLLLVPDLFGGSGTLHQPVYFNGYNLPEVTGYIGLLPLVACAALLTRTFGRNRDRASADWAPWLFMALLGLLLAWGQYTPLGGLFGHIWLFGRTRLQSRSLGIVDLALAVLFAFWADRALGHRHQWLGTAGWRRWVSAAPAMAAVVVCVVAIAFQRQLESAFGASGSGAGMTPWFVAQLVVALTVVALVLGWRHLGAVRARWALSAVIVVDLALFGLSSATGFASATPNVVEPSKAAAARVLGTEGRFAIDAPAYPASKYVHIGAIGQPDLNVFTTLPSVQGYGSIVDNTYGSATGTHFIDTLDPCALARGVFTPLRLGTLLIGPSQLAVEVPSSGVAPPARAPCPGARPAGTARQRTWYFGQALTLSGASLATPGRSASTVLVGSRVGVLRAGGAVTFPALTIRAAGDHATVAFSSPVHAVGLVVRGNPRAVSDTSEVTTAGGPSYALDGAVQDAVGQPGWAFTGTWEGNARFERASVLPPVWLEGGSAGATANRGRDGRQRHAGRPSDHVGPGAARSQRVEPPGVAGHGDADGRRGVPPAPDPCCRAHPGGAPACRLLDRHVHVQRPGPRRRPGGLVRRDRFRAGRGRRPLRRSAPGPAHEPRWRFGIAGRRPLTSKRIGNLRHAGGPWSQPYWQFGQVSGNQLEQRLRAAPRFAAVEALPLRRRSGRQGMRPRSRAGRSTHRGSPPDTAGDRARRSRSRPPGRSRS